MQIWQSISLPLSALVKQNFASMFASLLPLHSHGTNDQKAKAEVVLQMDMLAAAELTEDERDALIRKHMVGLDIILASIMLAVLLHESIFDHWSISALIVITDFENPYVLQIAIVSFLFRLCGGVETPQPPQFTVAAISSAVRIVVDGFLDMYEFQNHSCL